MVPRAPSIRHAVEPGRRFSSITHRASTPSGPVKVAGPAARLAGRAGRLASTERLTAFPPLAFPPPTCTRTRPTAMASTITATAAATPAITFRRAIRAFLADPQNADITPCRPASRRLVVPRAAEAGRRLRRAAGAGRRLAFQRSRDQAAHVEALQRHVDDDARDHRDDRAGQQQPVVDRAVGPGLHVAEGDRQGEEAV